MSKSTPQNRQKKRQKVRSKPAARSAKDPEKAPKTAAKKAAKKAAKEAAKKAAKKGSKKASAKGPAKTPKKIAKKYEHHPDHYNTSESYLIQDLDEDLRDAWQKLREFGESLGPQRIYASGRAIMFSKKVCYFFVRPKRSYLETVVFLSHKRAGSDFKSIQPVSKTKFAHTFRLIHPDQVEGALVEAISDAFMETPEAPSTSGS